jgi:hypothetical protein
MNKISTKLLQISLQSCVDEYKDVRTIFDKLDTKAQNITAIDGIFLAATLAFLDGGVFGQLDHLNKFIIISLIGASIVCVLFSILCCLYCLQTRKIAAPLKSDKMNKMVNDILEAEEDEHLEERYEIFYRDQIKIWQEKLNDKSMNTDKKAKSVKYGQALLIIAILLMAILLVFILGNV